MKGKIFKGILYFLLAILILMCLLLLLVEPGIGLTGVAFSAFAIYRLRKADFSKTKLSDPLFITNLDNEVDNTNINLASNKIVYNFFDSYVILDLETTGIDYKEHDIIEIGALKIVDNKIVSSFNTLVKPNIKISSEATAVNGITNNMVKNSPPIKEVIDDLVAFIGSNKIMGHNTKFDIGFLNNTLHKLGYPLLNNDLIDTYKLGRKMISGLESYKLTSLANHFNIGNNNAHRALSDCTTTFELYNALKKYAESNKFEYTKTGKMKIGTDNFGSIAPTNTYVNSTHEFYGKIIVFTGVLKSMTRDEAVQKAVNCGAVYAPRITLKTNYLILGDNSDNDSVKDGISTKQLKAEEYINRGKDIKIIDENEFIRILNK